jgi:hexosaminidase
MIKLLNSCKFLVKTLVLVLFISSASAQIKEQGIIPQPYKVEKSNLVFAFSPATGMAVGDGIDVNNLSFFNQYFRSLSGYTLSVNNKSVVPSINLDIDSLAITAKEGYRLTVTQKKIKIIGHDEAGGMHLDVSRHFFDVKTIKKWIDMLALYKINTFHWHLTDDQGWRIEIKKYPLLQSVSAYRDETIIGHKRDSPHQF